MSLLDTASLICTPNGYKEGKLYSVIPSDGSGDMSVTRATTATRVNSQGLVELVPYNLLQYSEDLTNAIWDKSVTITSNNTIAPNGTLTADLVTATSGNHLFQVPILTPSTQYTFSFYVKKGTASDAKYRVYNFDAGVNVVAPTSYISQTSTSDWARVSVTFTSTSSGTNYGIYLLDSASAGTMYFWGAQLVEGSVAKDYQKTETRLNIPRLDYSNGTCPSLLVEPQRTNIVTWSSSFDNASWIKLNGSVTANAATSPDGTTNADSFIPNTTSGIHALRSNNFNQSSTASHSWFLKANGYSKIAVRESDLVGNYASFDLSNGTLISTNQTGSIESYGNGWYRCTLVDTTTGAGAQTSIVVLPDSYTTGDPLIAWSGDGIKGVYAYGAQVEVGSYPTSYIPTTSASVTRNADVISKTGISSLIGQTEGTLFYDGYFGNGLDEVYMFIQKNGSTGIDDSMYIQRESSGSKIYFNVWLGGSQQSLIGGGNFAVGDRVKIACAYKTNDFVIYINGTQISFDTSGTPPTCDNIHLCTYGGAPTTAIYMAQGGTNASALWKTRLTNTQLAQLTTI